MDEQTTPPNPDLAEVEEVLSRLAELSDLEYDSKRRTAADALGIRVSTLDAEVAKRRSHGKPRAQVHPPVAPNDEPGVLLLEETVKFIRRFVVMTDAQLSVCALWALHTHAVGAAEYTPYLSISSAEKQSGKTRLFDVLSLLASNPQRSDSISVAALVRMVDREAPTLFLDELDATFNGDRERAEVLRGVLNSGFNRNGKYTRCVGEGAAIETKDFATFCPKALAGIGRLPDTIADRAVPIRLTRKRRDEPVERFRERKVSPDAAQLRQRLAGWAAAHLDQLRAAESVLPEQLNDRQQDVTEPLFALADLAGDDWPRRARAALLEVFQSQAAQDDSVGVRLLADIRTVFDAGSADRMSSQGLCDVLVELEGAPWAEWSHGKPITANRLARMLSRYGIAPRTIREGDRTAKGYLLEQFADAFSRYLPTKPSQPSQTNVYAGESHVSRPSQENPVTTARSEGSPLFPRVVTDVTACGLGPTVERDKEGSTDRCSIMDVWEI